MDVATIRLLRLARPFRPFAMVLTDGRLLDVDLPYRLAIAPSGYELAFASKTDGMIFIRPTDVKEVRNNGLPGEAN